MGVVSGLVMSYQFGTNWAAFSDKAGPVIGPLMAYEVLTAFFLEAGFLGVMLFGMKRVGPRPAFRRHLMVALGTLMSATWILSREYLDADAGGLHDRARRPVRSRRTGSAIIFNPSLSRTACRIWCSPPISASPFSSAASAHGICCATQRQSGGADDVLDGDVDGGPRGAGADRDRRPARAQHAANISPPRSRRWRATSNTKRGAPLILFGMPDMKERDAPTMQIAIPYLGSLILTHSLDGEVPGLKQWPRADRPIRR